MSGYNIIEIFPQKNEEDLKSFIPAYLSIWDNPENIKYIRASLRPFLDNDVSELIRNHFDKDCRYFVAVDEHDEILAVSEIRINHFDCYSISTLGVRPDAKRQGIGSSMIEHGIELAKELGYKAVEAMVFTDNFKIMRLLLSYEFTPENIHHHVRADGIDLMTMTKYL